MFSSDAISQAMETAVAEGVFPGAVLGVRLRGRLVFHDAFGFIGTLPPREPARLDTVYDLASLTKPLATTTALLFLIHNRVVKLDDRVEAVLPELTGSGVGGATIAHLLNHSAGLPGWRPFYEAILERERAAPGFLGSTDARDLVLDLIGREPLIAPIGTQSTYSDLGFMLLGFIIERLTGCSLATFCQERIYAHLGASPLFFVSGGRITGAPETSVRYQAAPTEQDPWRGRLLQGEVHDENAYALGGVAGHAGLFGTASAVLAVSRWWLEGYLGRSSLLDPNLVRRFVTRMIPGSSWALGWDTPSVPSSSGTYFSPTSFGHLGFTGTSLWIDPAVELEVVLLSNRVHPTRQNTRIHQFRPLIHDLVYKEFVGRG